MQHDFHEKLVYQLECKQYKTKINILKPDILILMVLAQKVRAKN